MHQRPFPPHEHAPRQDRARHGFGPWSRGDFGDFAPWGPGGPHREHGPGRRGPHAHGPGSRRGRRGDIRNAILTLLVEKPRHGYEIISEIAERSGGFWRPSPGSIYPTLQLLADEGLVISKDESGKKLFELTDEGRAAAEKQDQTPPWDHIAQEVDPNEVSLRQAGGTLIAAVIQLSQAGTTSQKARAIDVLNEARRAIYGILGEVEPTKSAEDDSVQE